MATIGKRYKLFDEPYTNTFLLARKKSGKTTALFEILKRTTDKKTRIVIIASTIHKDHIYKEMVKHFKKKCNPMAIYTYLKTDGYSVIDYELDKLNKPDEQQEEGEIVQDRQEEPKPKFLYFGKDGEKKKQEPPAERPSKYQTPEVVFLFDDLGSGGGMSPGATCGKKIDTTSRKGLGVCSIGTIGSPSLSNSWTTFLFFLVSLRIK